MVDAVHARHFICKVRYCQRWIPAFSVSSGGTLGGSLATTKRLVRIRRDRSLRKAAKAFNVPSGPMTIGRVEIVKNANVGWAHSAKRAAGSASACGVERQRKR